MVRVNANICSFNKCNDFRIVYLYVFVTFFQADIVNAFDWLVGGKCKFQRRNNIPFCFDFFYVVRLWLCIEISDNKNRFFLIIKHFIYKADLICPHFCICVQVGTYHYKAVEFQHIYDCFFLNPFIFDNLFP